MSTQFEFHVSAFFAATVLSAMAVAPSQADAAWTRNHASHCMTLGGTPIDYLWSIQNDSTTSAMLALCPIPDDDRFPKTSIRTINVHGYDGSTAASVTVAACYSDAFVTGGACGNGATSSLAGTGDYGLGAVPPAAPNNWVASDFGYIYVYIPAKQGASRSTLRGYYTST
jgi:hypothetical protein